MMYLFCGSDGRREVAEKGTGSQEGTAFSSRERSPLLLKLPFVNSLPGSVGAIVPGKSSIENQALQAHSIFFVWGGQNYFLKPGLGC